MGLTNLEEFVFSIFKLFTTKSRTIAIATLTPLPAGISAKEIMIILSADGNILVNGVTFPALAKTAYTFRHIADLSVITTNQNGAAIYYQ